MRERTLQVTTPRMRLRVALRTAGLLGTARRLRAAARAVYRLLSAWEFRRQLAERRRFQDFALRYRDALARPLGPATAGTERALIVGRLGRTAEAQVMLAKVLRMAGYAPSVLLEVDDRFLRPYYELAEVSDIELWRPSAESARFTAAAQTMLRRCESRRAVLDLESEGVRVGRSAVSTTMRASQATFLELDLDPPDPRLVRGLAAALAAAAGAGHIVERLAPALTVSYEMDYTPKREIFDACLARGVPVVAACRAPRRDALLLKRYSASNRDQHPSALSDASWERLRRMPWTAARRQELRDEVRQCYATGDWWGIPSVQASRGTVLPDEVRRRLRLDPGKTTAFIFPHVPWDASFCWGDDVFGDYQTWLLETLRAARDNPRVNWVVRIHPANLGKSRRMRDGAEPIELAAIRRQLGALPPHLVLLPPDSAIGTDSLFGVMDHCLTVRGTVGIEAASLGIPVLTAGTGRYDRRGFTHDSASAGQYLERVRRIHEIPRLTDAERELAERFAYGMFVLRPLALERALVRKLQEPGEAGTGAWRPGPELQAFADWLRDAASEDFLMPEAGTETAPAAREPAPILEG